VLTQARLKELLSYDPETGLWVWLCGHNKGQIAGTINSKGHRQIYVDGKLQRSARLAWVYMTGSWPRNIVDHKNRVPDDDRWENLREATLSQNGFNRRAITEFKGVQKRPSGSKYYLGTYDTAEEVHEAYIEAAKAQYGEFACGGEQ